jgi:hypothetical protein
MKAEIIGAGRGYFKGKRKEGARDDERQGTSVRLQIAERGLRKR